MNPWEVQAFNYEFPEQGSVNHDGSSITTASAWRRGQDPIIYPGLYAPSGFDIMAILLRIVSRPNPQIDLGAVDASVSLVLCDLDQPDVPIIYATDAFCHLTGYPLDEIIGRNCRFLQHPPGKGRRSGTKSTDKTVRRMRHAVRDNEEIQLCVKNFRRNGQSFTNLLSIIPVPPDASGARYSVGFQCEYSSH